MEGRERDRTEKAGGGREKKGWRGKEKGRGKGNGGEGRKGLPRFQKILVTALLTGAKQSSQPIICLVPAKHNQVTIQKVISK